MSRDYLRGVVLIVGAAMVGAVIAFGLYQWESNKRASEAHLFAETASATTAEAATPTPTGTGASGAGTQASADAGSKAFATNCAACHPGGKAGVGPAVSGKEFFAKYPDDAAIKSFIRAGKGSMPAYSASMLSDSELDDIIAYLHSLQ